jgi:hypothetical protein
MIPGRHRGQVPGQPAGWARTAWFVRAAIGFRAGPWEARSNRSGLTL